LTVWAVGLVAGVVTVAAEQQDPRFEGRVDLVLVDVQAVDRNGQPVRGLTPANFEVSVSGRRQRIVSADFFEVAGSGSAAPAPQSDGVVPNRAPRVADPRLYVIALDTLSVPPDLSPGMVAAAQAFVGRLQPTDLVAVHAYPLGPKINPTTDHAAVGHTLGQFVGTGEGRLVGSRFYVTPAESLEMAQALRSNLRNDPVYQEVLARECPPPGNPPPECVTVLEGEAIARAGYYDALARTSVGGLRDLIAALTPLPGRKTLVLMTAGLVASDRPGGRPDVSDLAVIAGQEAARSNTTVYSIFVDNSYLSRYSASAPRAATSRYIPQAREADQMSRFFDSFSGLSGGMLIRDLVGRGEAGFDRVIRETSAFYRLAIEPLPADRAAATARRLSVKTNARNTTIRSQSWVIDPQPTP
jgi:VWFA-related protein